MFSSILLFACVCFTFKSSIANPISESHGNPSDVMRTAPEGVRPPPEDEGPTFFSIPIGRKDGPACCTPEKCIDGYERECIAGALSPRLEKLGYHSYSGACTGRLFAFDCRIYKEVCSGNRGRCETRPCNRQGDLWFQHENPNLYSHFIKVPGTLNLSVKPKTSSHSICESEEKVNGDDKNKEENENSVCSKDNGQENEEKNEMYYGGECKERGCRILHTPNGPRYFGPSCDSKGCPVPFNMDEEPGDGTEKFVERQDEEPGVDPYGYPEPDEDGYTRSESGPQFPRRVPPIQLPPAGHCCYARRCLTQLLCRCEPA